MKLVPRACPLCGSDDDADVAAEARVDAERLTSTAFASRKTPEFMHHRMVRCPDCDCLYANPAPELGWIRDEYRAAAFEAGEESRHAARTYARVLRPVLARLPDRRGALDVGAGDGAFLFQLHALGFTDLVGIEPSRAPIAQANAAVRPFLREGFFRGDEVPEGSLSLVTCFQVLEHADDPAGLCRAALRLLKPGGALFAIAHNHRSVLARALGTRSPIFDVEHLQLLSPGSLRHLFESTGFVDARVRVLRNDYPLGYWTRLLPLGERPKRGLSRVLDATRLSRLVLPMWAGNLVGVAYKARD